ncbi:hypothetical protein PC129_g5241 [Phytophthora cactorum]|uniref:Uncharacterized protein n=1 Tax=Phytophthora cactorum TaxID=29920 RepID=A0A8T1DTJ9_9STRA|nr:hypothetical protein Pcac1_g21135 [Phytophthora cactorum]KAG2834638.1 hypothetical protein PC111_g5753 [Phytophthora cactorum]KAG2837529.1 hypothetical protein PC112_g4873 [Phytophthora cactorum]KAG2861532.1 hypothetical protein PC113_g7089 [Phytophthora cactorum]KAG2922614.1 hypothetical protein PC114_g5190 [Phytophthora cactorum]
MMVLSSNEQYRYALAALEPVLNILSQLSTVDCFQQLPQLEKVASEFSRQYIDHDAMVANQCLCIQEEGDDEDSSSDDEALGVVDRLDVIDDTAGCNEKETLAGMHGSQPAPGSPVVENSTQNSYPNGNEQSADATITEISASTTSDVSALGDTSETTEPAFEITGAAFTATTTCDTSTVDATVSNDHLRSPLLQVPAVWKCCVCQKPDPKIQLERCLNKPNCGQTDTITLL